MRLSVAIFLAVSVFTTTRAHATSTMASALQNTLGLGARPPCTTCHTTPNGGSGTATQPFVLALYSRGFVFGDTASLKTAVMALEAEGKDSDGDGTGDIAELRAGTDPNLGAGGAAAEYPEYGCSVQGEQRSTWLATALSASTLLALLSLRRRSPSTTAKSS